MIPALMLSRISLINSVSAVDLAISSNFLMSTTYAVINIFISDAGAASHVAQSGGFLKN
jgi:hypothetical protein